MAAVPVTLIGIFTFADGHSVNGTFNGVASLSGLSVGGGPAEPPPGYPAHPIAPGGPPPGIWPSPGHPAHPIAPGGPPPEASQGPGLPTHPIAPGGQPPGIWGGG